MRIGAIEIRWYRVKEATPLTRQVPEGEVANAFAVADTTLWWRALLQVIDTAEWAANKRAQDASGADDRMCIYSAAGAHHLAMLREEFVRLREAGIRGRAVDGASADVKTAAGGHVPVGGGR